MLRVSEVLGRTVLTQEGRQVGRLIDLVVDLGPNPRVVRLRARGPRRRMVEVSWSAVSRVDASAVELGPKAELVDPTLRAHELLLARHILDAQIIDRRGKALTRVGDVELEIEPGALVITGVEVGARPLLRRLGLGRLARRAESRSLPWSELQLASHRGRIVQLAARNALLPGGQPPSHSDLVEGLAPGARRRRFPFRWIRRATT